MSKINFFRPKVKVNKSNGPIQIETKLLDDGQYLVYCPQLQYAKIAPTIYEAQAQLDRILEGVLTASPTLSELPMAT